MNTKSSWHREEVGGMWEKIGNLQFDFLKKMGLKPEHYFLDVGCGSLRGGVHFINYLEPSHYFGIDKNKELLDAGKNIELKKEELETKKPTLIQMDNFAFDSLNQKFDYALAQSVFTHLPMNNIIRCVMNIGKVLVNDGKFFATFFENKEGKFNLEPIMHHQIGEPDAATYFDQDPYHYDFETFEYICKGTYLIPTYIGNWNHPRDQKMIIFTKNS